MSAEQIDQHLARCDEVQRAALAHIRQQLRTVMPTATETIKYRMPCFTVMGKGVACFDAFQHHWSYFPMSGSVVDKLDRLPEWADARAGTLRVPLTRRLPMAVVRRLVRIRLDEISAVTNGKRYEFFDDGSVKAAGSMKDGELHGAWQWWRADGTLMRAGTFSRGEPVGTWQTFDRHGEVVTQTRVG